MRIQDFKVTEQKPYFIKLGAAGIWETESLRDGVIRFGYRTAPHTLCMRGDWPGVWHSMKGAESGAGAVTRHVTQIKVFYETDERSIFITFVGGCLYWCRPTGPVELLADGNRRRATVDGWHNTSVGGRRLSTDRLSGHLLKVQMFQGTICEVRAADYLLRKLNDELSPEVAAAEAAESALLSAIVDLMRLLTRQDFELLVDLVFSTSGWRRVSQTGGVQKTIDLELVLPTTGERAFVQIKSKATKETLDDYTALFTQTVIYGRMFFVWHTGDLFEEDNQQGVTLIGPKKLSRMVLDSGLTSWLREKVS